MPSFFFHDRINHMILILLFMIMLLVIKVIGDYLVYHIYPAAIIYANEPLPIIITASIIILNIIFKVEVGGNLL